MRSATSSLLIWSFHPNISKFSFRRRRMTCAEKAITFTLSGLAVSIVQLAYCRDTLGWLKLTPVIMTCRCLEDCDITNQLAVINYVEKSYLIPDVEKSCKTASRRLVTTTKITVCTVYVQAERPQQRKIITTCQKGHLNCTDGGNQIQRKICTFWKKFHNALRLLTI